MAFMTKGIIDLKGILFLVLLTTSQATNLDCYGKAFHCVNSTHFMICVDLGGTSTTIDDVIIPCPSPTVCRRSNRFECEFPLPSIPSSTVAPEILTTESEVTTFIPLASSIPFEEYFNTVSTTTSSETELQPSKDTILSVKPVTGPDVTSFWATEINITEKSVPSDAKATPETGVNATVVNIISKPIDTIISDVESIDTLYLNVTPNETSVQDSQATTQTLVTVSLKLNTKYASLGNSTIIDTTSTGREQNENTENGFTTDFGLEDITETVIFSSTTEVPINTAITEVVSTTPEPIVITDHNFATSVQDFTDIGTIDDLTTKFDITISLASTQDAKQINESLPLGNEINNTTDNINDVVELSVNASSVETTSAVPEKTVFIDQDLKKSFQELTFNVTITDNISSLPDSTTPLEPTKDVIEASTSQSLIDMINDAAFSDVNIAQKATNNIILTTIDQSTRSPILDTMNTATENIALSMSTTIEPTENIQLTFTEDPVEALLNITEITFINTETPVNAVVPTDFTNDVTQPLITNDQVLTNKIVNPLNATVQNIFSFIPGTISIVKESSTDIKNTSKSVNSIDTDITRDNTTTIIINRKETDTDVTEMPTRTNIVTVTSADLTTAETKSVGVTDEQNYQEFQHNNTLSHLSVATEVVVTIEPMKVKNQVTNGTIPKLLDNADTLNIISSSDVVATTEYTLQNKNFSQNHFNNVDAQPTTLDDITQNNVTNSHNAFPTVHYTVPDLLIKPGIAISYVVENYSATAEITTVNTIEELSSTEVPPSENVTSSTTELNYVTDIEMTILLNDSEMLTSTTTPNLAMTTENLVDDPQSDAESLSYDINNQGGNTIGSLIQNGKVLSTNTADNKPLTQVYDSDSSNKTVSNGLIIETTTRQFELLLNESDTKKGIEVNKTTELISPELAVYEKSISKTDLNQIRGPSIISHDNNSVTLIDQHAQTVIDKSSTSIRNVSDNDSFYVDILFPAQEHTNRLFLSDQHDVTTTESTTLSTPTVIVDQNENVSSEFIKTLQQTDTIPFDTSTSIPSTTVSIIEAANESSLLHYTFTENTNKINEDTTISNTNYQIESPTENAVLLIKNSNIFVKNIDDSTSTSEVLTASSIKEQELQLSNSDITITQSTATTHTLSEISTMDPALEEIIIPGKYSTDSSTTIENINAYILSLSDFNNNNPPTPEKNLLESSTLASDVIPNPGNPTGNIKNSDAPTGLPDDSYNFSTNARATETPLTTITNNPITESNNKTLPNLVTEKNLLENTRNTLENTLPILLVQDEKYEDLSFSTTNAQTDYTTTSYTSRNYVAKTSSNNKITTFIPVIIENTVSSTLNTKSVNEKPTTESNRIESVAMNSSNLSTTTQKTMTLNTKIRRGFDAVAPTIPNIPEVDSGTTEIPMMANTDSNKKSTIKDSVYEELTDAHVTAINLDQQTNSTENDTFNLITLVASNQKLVTPFSQTDLRHTLVAIDKINEVTSSLNIRTTSEINGVRESLQTQTLPSSNNEFYPGLSISTLKKEDKQRFIDDPRYDTLTTTSNLSTLILLEMFSTESPDLNTYDEFNAQNSESLLTQASDNFTPVTLNTTSQLDTNIIGKEVPGQAGPAQTFSQNYDTTEINSIPADDNDNLSVTLSETVNSNNNLNMTKPIVTSVTISTDLNILIKQNDSTVADVNTDVLNVANTHFINDVYPNTITELPSRLTEPQGMPSINITQVSQSSPVVVAESEINSTHALSGMHSQIYLKTTRNIDYVTNVEPTTGPFRRDLVTGDGSQVFTENINGNLFMKMLGAGTFIREQPTETSKKEGNTNIGTFNFKSDTERVTRPEITTESSIRFAVPGVYNDQSTWYAGSPDFVPSEVITTSEVLVDSKIESEKTHSGIISFVKQPPKFHQSKEKKEKPGIKETESGEKQEHAVNVEVASLQDKGLFTLQTDTSVPPVKDNNNKTPRDISTTEESLVKMTNNDYNITNYNNISKNIRDDTKATVSGYEKETPTQELIENSTTPTSDTRTSNDKSQDQNMSIFQVHNESVISTDQSSTSRYMSQTKLTAAGYKRTTVFPSLESTSQKTETNKFSCKLKKRGRYADELDCRKFYICPGNKLSHVVEGTCPVNTVFSKINKQCTKNLSHCIRNKQFRCVAEGRFSDFLNDDIYYICVRNNLSHFIRFKLQCQNGYRLNKTSVRCVLNNDSTSTNDSKSASEQSSSSIKQYITEKPQIKFKCKKEGVFPDPSNCKKYFECTKVASSYRQKKKKCDSDEIFHKDKKKCVDADSYEC